MTPPSRRSARARRRGTLLIAAALLLGCRPDMDAWNHRLAEPAISKLAGAWSIEAHLDGERDGPATSPARTSGVLALVMNRERVTTSFFGEPPVAFGTYDISFDSLGLSTGDEIGTPDVWVKVRGDSVMLRLSPGAKWPITLTGVWRGDTLVGRWHADQRAGASGVGDFVLERR